MLRRVKCGIAAAVLTVVATASAWAAGAADGKWNWKQMTQQGEITINLELKQDGEKLTGSVTRGDMKTEISEGTIKDNALSFAVVRERDGQQFKVVYKGKIEGDTIKGNTVMNINGEERTREWTANRVK